MVAYCNIRKDLLEQHAICALHCVVYFMLHLYARLFYALACVCVHLVPWDSCYCSYTRRLQTLLQTKRVPSAAEKSISCLYDSHNFGLARHDD